MELLFGKALKNCFFFKLKLCPQIFTWYWDNFILWKMVKKYLSKFIKFDLEIKFLFLFKLLYFGFFRVKLTNFIVKLYYINLIY